ncbi:hypothetical protein V5O48_013139 [Marasmius crinis-equi]|uniref:Uncharacterized protein n=1 Tax=Marasmius crinis-equi TaxID=585013 RepID=A0ABR3F0W8_9AGAR
MATASGMLSMISSATQEHRGLTVGSGIGAGFCSLVAGSIGFYEQISKQSSREQGHPDPERGRDPIELRLGLPGTADSGFVRDTEASTAVSTGIEQRGLRSRRWPREPSSSKPYVATRSSGSSTKRQHQKSKKPIRATTAYLEDLRDVAKATNFRNLDLLPELAMDIAQIAEEAKANKAVFRQFAKEASALAQATVDTCKQNSNEPSLQSYVDSTKRALQQIRDFAVASSTLESSPVVDIDRPVLQAYREMLVIARRQLAARGMRTSGVVEVSPWPQPSSSGVPSDVADSADRSLAAIVEVISHTIRRTSG